MLPTAADDTFFTAQNQALVVDAMSGVIANDSEGLSVTAFDAASVGGAAVNIAADGSLTYTPADGFWGPDGFEYTIADESGETASATVTVFVAPRQIPLAQITAGHGGFVLDGELENDYSGASVSGGADVNGDGMDDLIVGAPKLRGVR